MSIWLRPTLGLIAGCILYYLSILDSDGLTGAVALPLSIALTFPLFGLQIKAPEKNWLRGILILVIMGLVYGGVFRYLMIDQSDTLFIINPIFMIQCLVSAFIFFMFYCVVMEEKAFVFPYVTLFEQTWQVILKVFLAKLLILLALGLFYLAAMLFEQLNILVIKEFVLSRPFAFITPALLFGIAMTILHQHEELITKLRNIVLAFSYFLYPIIVIISIGFLLTIPFAAKPFSGFWELTVILNVSSLILFNGIFQDGITKPPYASWFRGLIYLSFFLQLIYSIDVLRFPWTQAFLYHDSVSLLLLLSLALLVLYNACYAVAIFSKEKHKPWLSFIQPANTVIALLMASLYLVVALPGVHLLAPVY